MIGFCYFSKSEGGVFKKTDADFITESKCLSTHTADRQHFTCGIAIQQRYYIFLNIFNISFQKQMTGRWFLPTLHQTEKCGHCWESTDLDTAELMQLYTFDTLPDVSVTTPTSHLLTTGLITTFSLREIYFEVPFLKSANGHDCNCYWYLERCKKMPPVKIYGGHLI